MGLPNTKNTEGPPSLHTPSAEKEKTSGYRTHRGSPRLNQGACPGLTQALHMCDSYVA